MLEPKFVLKRPKEDKTSIFIRIYHSKKVFKYYLPVSVNPKKWDSGKQRLKKEKFNTTSAKINSLLDKTYSKIRDWSITQIEQNETITNERIKDLLDDYFSDSKKIKETFLMFIDKYIEQKKSEVLKGRIKHYKSFKVNFELFCSHKNKIYSFESLDHTFYYDFIEFLYLEKEHSSNTVGHQISILKAILKESIKQKVTKVRHFEGFKRPSHKVENVYLNNEEILKIWNFNTKNFVKLQKAKELFVLGCLTGFRYSDFSKIQSHHIKKIDDVNVLDVVTGKTQERVIIPIKPLVLEILKKNNYSLPTLSNQKLNDYIKELCELVGLDDEVVKTNSVAGKPVTKTYKKWELISSHTARRSFATNAYKAGVPSIALMKITGHTSETSFLKYICITKEENALLMSQHQFFKT